MIGVAETISVEEKVLVLSKKDLFGANNEFLFDGVLSIPPNEKQISMEYPSSDAMRELSEELVFEKNYEWERPLGWVYLPNCDDGINPLHIGHINIVKFSARDSVKFMSESEHRTAQNSRWLSLQEILGSVNTAPWTRAIAPVLALYVNDC